VPEKRKGGEKRGKNSRKDKKRREDSDGGDWQANFEKMWERSFELEKERFERTEQLLRESQRLQLEQTNAIMAGFKDIFQNVLK